MITDTDTALAGLLAGTAAAVVQAMPCGEVLIAGELTRETGALQDAQQALLAPFAGARSGEVLLAVDAELAAALLAADEGPIDLVTALAPTMEAIAAALGDVTLGQVQLTEARLTVNRILAAADSGVIPLLGANGPRAAVALALTPAPAEPLTAVDAPVAADRLDLLRGVEMDATAELGRTRMTVNDLLALRAGVVVELDRVAGGPADLLVNGRLIARGEVVVVDENYGIRITQVVADPTAR